MTSNDEEYLPFGDEDVALGVYRGPSASPTFSSINVRRRSASSSPNLPPSAWNRPEDTNWHSIRSYSNGPRMSRIRFSFRCFYQHLVNLISTQRRSRFRLFLYSLIAALVLGFAFLATHEPHIEISIYSRRWIQQEVDPVLPLSSCFDLGTQDESLYNITERIWEKRTRWDVHSGMDMGKGLTCYDFAGTIGRDWHRSGSEVGGGRTQGQRTMYHTYWRTDLAPFGTRQEYMLKSFFATQPLSSSHLILWSNGDLSTNPIIQHYLKQAPDYFSTRRADVSELSRGTVLKGSERLNNKDAKAWLDGDLLRLLVIWNFGGVWVDMDSLLTRNLHPLFEHEFVTQWDCYSTSPLFYASIIHVMPSSKDKPYTPLNGALMHFYAYSPYICEAFHIIETSSPPRPGTTDWGSLLYTKLWRRLVHGGITPFKILPWCFSDGRTCRIDNRLPDPFKKDGTGEDRWVSSNSRFSFWPFSSGQRGDRSGSYSSRIMSMEAGGLLDSILHKVFSVHLHNQWEKDFPSGGWVDRLLLRRYEDELGTGLLSGEDRG
ncbi:hypothetical protein FA15DRAFT_364823 [Coprinopsis marcescibilis]|uniref:Glycosyltransferase family 32 protein n=1 Tax=Coprinopsis marcescibilis TaxID=230819 RepID=A0A5C3KYN1_COPMA|nr:hypothetical protein FA15DRAFT_364823 [Coprinopsis marcescibilis]